MDYQNDEQTLGEYEKQTLWTHGRHRRRPSVSCGRDSHRLGPAVDEPLGGRGDHRGTPRDRRLAAGRAELLCRAGGDGEVTRGYLGGKIQTITPELANALDVEENQGALVADVVPGGPADEGGIKHSDIIVSYDGKDVKEGRDLPAMVAATPVDEEVVFHVPHLDTRLSAHYHPIVLFMTGR